MVEQGWFCHLCKEKTWQRKTCHNTVFHEKKSFSFLCPCGYGSLIEKEMFQHFLDAHGKTVDIRSPTFRPYWWSSLPGFYEYRVCSKCKLKTPLERFFENHKCVNFTMSKAIPSKLEWQTSIGRNQRPLRPFCRAATDIDRLSEDMRDKVDLNAKSQMEWFDSSTGYIHTSVKTGSLPQKPIQPTPNPGFDFGAASAAFRTFDFGSTPPGFSPLPNTFQEPDLEKIEIYINGTSKVTASTGYEPYTKLMGKDGIEMKMRGFLEGHLVDYSAIASIDEILSCGRYVVTDCHAQIVADVFVSPHVSSLVLVAETPVTGYNPAKLPIVGDMLNLATQPFMMTHHLALSNILKVGEYRITRKSSNGKYTTARFWLSNGRKNLLF